MSSEARVVTDINAYEITEWCKGRMVMEHDALDHDKAWPGINVPCGDDVKRASLGDIVIKKHDGTFDVHKNH